MTANFSNVFSANEYGFYCVPDTYKGREVPALPDSGEVYQPRTLKLLCVWAKTDDIITGGAFVADFFPTLSRALAPKARLYSFEPNPMSHAAARKTIRLNCLDNLHLECVAVGRKAGKLHLQTACKVGASAAAAAAKIVKDPKNGETVDVKVTALDDLVPKSRIVSVLQLDIEGHESEALAGARRIISASKPLIVLESVKRWQQRSYLDIINAGISEATYRIAGHMERNTFYLPDRCE